MYRINDGSFAMRQPRVGQAPGELNEAYVRGAILASLACVGAHQMSGLIFWWWHNLAELED